MKKIIGYTTGVYDMFHIGHLNILKNAKKYCDYLIVGVSTDEVVSNQKGVRTIIPFEERIEIVSAIKYVDKVVPQYSYEAEDKIDFMKKNDVDILFVGSDWQGSQKWNNIEIELKKMNKKVIYLKHTDGISSTQLREILNSKK